MTYQQYLMEQVDVIDLLLLYLPYCDDELQYNEIMIEVSRIRRSIRNIEEMTRTERWRKMKKMTLTIESDL